MFVTADQLAAHAVGDYLLQSHYMATEKTKRSIAALAHVATYGLPFLLLSPSVWQYLAIVSSHFVIDRWRLARYVVWAKNFLAPAMFDGASSVGFPRWQDEMSRRGTPSRRVGPRRRATLFSVNPPWSECSATGYPPNTPPWLAVWLLIIADNVLHVLCNAAALAWLP